MEVRGLNSVGAASPIARTAPVSAAGPAAPAGPTAPRDEVEISSVGRMLDEATRAGGIREQRLAEIKSAIEAGTYESPEKLQIALERLLERIGGDDAG
jgi:negative regulator of flagellin synthesis FlgM